MVIQVGLEPTTLYLKGRYSTTELLDQFFFSLIIKFYPYPAVKRKVEIKPDTGFRERAGRSLRRIRTTIEYKAGIENGGMPK